MASRPPTIDDVAREAGVSVSTVSRVIRSSADVNETTRRRVREVIFALDYHPSNVARALSTGNSKTIALLVSDIANPFYPQLALSVEREARKRGFAVVIANTEDDAEASAAYVRQLLDLGVEGIIYASVGRDEEAVLRVISDWRRLVFTNRRPHSTRLSYVVADSAQGASLVTRHLVDLGHRRIGFVAGPTWAANAQDQLESFLATCRELGVHGLVADGDFSMETGAAAMTQWLATTRPPTAVIGVNDVVALGVLSVLADAGTAGECVAVAGCDDINISRLRIVNLTSVAQHTAEMAEKSVQVLIRQISGKAKRPVHLILEPTLQVRGSTASRRPPQTSEGIGG